VKTLALVAKRGKPETLALAAAIKGRYANLSVLAEDHLAQMLGWETVSESEFVSHADLMIVLGGDGTLIHAARMLKGRPVPILGVNLGSLGFMTEVPSADLFPLLDEIVAGRMKTGSRMKLSCRLWRGGQVIAEDEVLNDVVIGKSALARIGDHEMTMDGQYVTTFKADGVIIATPTGSTAYAMSAGGPIVHPALDAIVVAPICPHALTQRPIVVPPDQQIHITLKSDVADFYLTIDGQAGFPLRQEDRLNVERSPNRVILVRNPRLDYFGVLRQKLRWGER
jgi:NAD+ kinase